MGIMLKGIGKEREFLESYLTKREPQIISLIPDIDRLDWECSKVSANKFRVELKVLSGDRELVSKSEGDNLYSSIRSAIKHMEIKAKKSFGEDESKKWGEKIKIINFSRAA